MKQITKKVIIICIVIAMLCSMLAGLGGCNTNSELYVFSECGDFRLAADFEVKERDSGGKVISVTTSLTNQSDEDINIMLPWTLSDYHIGNLSTTEKLSRLMAAQVDMCRDGGVAYPDTDDGYRHKTTFPSGKTVYGTRDLLVHESWFTQRNITVYLFVEAFFFTGETVFSPQLGVYVYSDLVHLDLMTNIILRGNTRR